MAIYPASISRPGIYLFLNWIFVMFAHTLPSDLMGYLNNEIQHVPKDELSTSFWIFIKAQFQCFSTSPFFVISSPQLMFFHHYHSFLNHFGSYIYIWKDIALWIYVITTEHTHKFNSVLFTQEFSSFYTTVIPNIIEHIHTSQVAFVFITVSSTTCSFYWYFSLCYKIYTRNLHMASSH